jgi:outer membrane protein assembly factor BamE
MRISSLALVLAAALSGCGWLYKQPVQQGNVLEPEQIDSIKPGMTKRQVSLVLGSPALQNAFRDDRWDYVSSYKDPDGVVELKRFTVVFDDGVLVRTEGDYEPGNAAEKAERELANDGES